MPTGLDRFIDRRSREVKKPSKSTPTAVRRPKKSSSNRVISSLSHVTPRPLQAADRRSDSFIGAAELSKRVKDTDQPARGVQEGRRQGRNDFGTNSTATAVPFTSVPQRESGRHVT